MPYYVYILNSKEYNKYYIGSTQDVPERLLRHNSGKERFTKKFIPWNLILQLEKESRSEAYQLELKLKNLNREKFIKFIEKYKL
jgi:putative endonuclease